MRGKQRHKRYVLLGLSALLLSCAWGWTAPPVVDTYPIPKLVTERQRGNLNHLYTFEHSPLGNRTPVVLVPGRAEEFQHHSWWKHFRDTTYKYKAFDDRFKLYAYIYNSKDELSRQANGLAQELKLYFRTLPKERKVLMVSYSLGGVMTREAMEDPEVFRRVEHVIALGVPFHGSPLFDMDWFTQYLRPQNKSPLRQFWDRFVYRAYFFNKVNLQRGLKWNNFDSSKPKYAAEKIQGDVIVTKILPYEERDTTALIKQKMTIYASYLENKYTSPHKNVEDFNLTSLISKTRHIPKELIGSVLPLYGTSVHDVFTYMNHQLSNLPTYSSEDSKGENTHLYRFNDGVIPLSSALYLPSRKMPYQETIEGLAESSDAQKIRVFVNLDHMDLGDYNRNVKKIKAVDIIHPTEGSRTPCQWILYDLQKIKSSHGI